MSETFERIYRRHAAAVFRFAVSVVGRAEIAEEITGEAFLALFRNLDAIDESQLPGWLITVVRNRAMSFWRHEAHERRYLEALERKTSADTNSVSETGDERSLLDDPELKPVHRVCLTLRYVEGLSRAEIADFTGLSEMQVKGHLQHGLRLLRKGLVGTGER